MTVTFWQLVLATFLAFTGLDACKYALREGYVFANCWWAMRVFAKTGECLLCKQRGGPPWSLVGVDDSITYRACAVCGKRREPPKPPKPPPNVVRFPLHAPPEPPDAA